MGMLIGTDFNIGGIRGIGPKNALKLVKKYGSDFNNLFEDVKWDDFFDVEWQEVFGVIKNMPVTDDYELKWRRMNREKIMELLVEKHEFNRERVEKTLDDIEEDVKKGKQKGLGEFF